MPKVLNKYRDEIPSDAVYIGRGSPWGNPYRITENLDRTEVIEAYRLYLYWKPALQERMRKDLRGKDLVCFCAPKPCHGDIILEVANS